jgi:hypothetical protein
LGLLGGQRLAFGDDPRQHFASVVLALEPIESQRERAGR